MQQENQNEGFVENINEQEDIDLSPEIIQKVSSQMHKIATIQTDEAKNKVYRAIEALNGVRGLQEYVGAVQADKYQSVFDGIKTTIMNLSGDIERTAKDIWKENEMKRAQLFLHDKILDILNAKILQIEEQKRQQRNVELFLEVLKATIEVEELEKARIEALEEMIRIQVEEDVRKEIEETRKKHEFSEESLLSGDYFSVLDEIEQKTKDNKPVVEPQQIDFLQNALSNAVTAGFGSEEYGEKYFYEENS